VDDPSDLVTIPDVEVTHTTDWAIRCRVAGREAWVPRNKIAGQGLRHSGDRGTLMIPRALAVDLGLI
jgi:hypothetical protein